MRKLPIYSSISLLMLATIACGDMEYQASDYSDSGWSGAADSGQSENGDDDNDLGSETEADFLKLAPSATNVYVFVVNSARNTVSRISVPELDVLTTEVGIDPTVAVTTQDYSRAVVFNAGSDEVSLIDAETMEVTNVEVRSNFNNMVLSSDGTWALVYNDADLPQGTSTGNLQSFNEISLVNTLTGEHTSMAVGFHPRQVAFTPDSSQVLVVAEGTMAILDLDAETIKPRLVELDEDSLDPAQAEEVVIEPTGQFAFVRQFGEDDLVVVELASETLSRVNIGFNPTDLDLSPDGTLAVVVSRGSNELHILDAQDPLGAKRVVALPEGEILGSLQFSPDGTKGILYTTASPVAHYTTWDVDTDQVKVRDLEKPVESVSVSPTGGTLLVLHSLEDDPETPTSSPFYGQHALTMIDLDSFLANPLLLPAKPSATANSADGLYGYFIMDGVSSLAVLRYEQLLFDEVPLRSDPVHLGVLPESSLAFVNQEHPLGRLSFYEPSTQELQTITGFELNAEIEH
ncbi:MAG: DNA-binding beta-propeller fold protein YncE [Cognaticolwellia sp.]|jgi:DNA-binding beta-propeller fold protein YncE